LTGKNTAFQHRHLLQWYEVGTYNAESAH